MVRSTMIFSARPCTDLYACGTWTHQTRINNECNELLVMSVKGQLVELLSDSQLNLLQGRGAEHSKVHRHDCQW